MVDWRKEHPGLEDMMGPDRRATIIDVKRLSATNQRNNAVRRIERLTKYSSWKRPTYLFIPGPALVRTGDILALDDVIPDSYDKLVVSASHEGAYPKVLLTLLGGQEVGGIDSVMGVFPSYGEGRLHIRYTTPQRQVTDIEVPHSGRILTFS